MLITESVNIQYLSVAWKWLGYRISGLSKTGFSPSLNNAVERHSTDFTTSEYCLPAFTIFYIAFFKFLYRSVPPSQIPHFNHWVWTRMCHPPMAYGRCSGVSRSELFTYPGLCLLEHILSCAKLYQVTRHVRVFDNVLAKIVRTVYLKNKINRSNYVKIFVYIYYVVQWIEYVLVRKLHSLYTLPRTVSACSLFHAEEIHWNINKLNWINWI